MLKTQRWANFVQMCGVDNDVLEKSEIAVVFSDFREYFLPIFILIKVEITLTYNHGWAQDF